MLYDAIQATVAQLNTNFVADITAVATAKGVNNIIDLTLGGVYPNVMGHQLGRVGLPLPGIGVYPIDADSSAKTQGQRKTLAGMALDYVAEGPNQDTMFTQEEIALEAIMLTIDRIAFQVWTGVPGGSRGTFGAGNPEHGVKIRFMPPTEIKSEGFFRGRVILRVPTWQQDTGL